MLGFKRFTPALTCAWGLYNYYKNYYIILYIIILCIELYIIYSLYNYYIITIIVITIIIFMCILYDCTIIYVTIAYFWILYFYYPKYTAMNIAVHKTLFWHLFPGDRFSDLRDAESVRSISKILDIFWKELLCICIFQQNHFQHWNVGHWSEKWNRYMHVIWSIIFEIGNYLEKSISSSCHSHT